MGWFEGTAKYFDKHGQVDRKKCMRAEFSDESCILKDAMVGSTYYAATRLADGNVSIFVGLTSVREKYYFAYKPMDASMGPCKYDCPESILKLNTLHDGYTDEWMAKCREKRAKKNELLSTLKKATKIKVVMPFETQYHKEGQEVVLQKNKTLRGGDEWCSTLYWPIVRFPLKLLRELWEEGAVEVVE